MINILRGYIKKGIFIILIRYIKKVCEFGATTQILLVVLENYIQINC